MDLGNDMRISVSRTLLRDYLAARDRANRFIRDSSPPLTQKGLAQILDLEISAFNKFINGTIFVDNLGEKVPVGSLRKTAPLFLASKWTEKRLSRFIERVQTECWRLGIIHKPNAMIQSAARDETERLRLSKYFFYLCDIKDASNLGIASGLSLWNVCAQEATDARQHLQPTMCVNALLALGDIVDRKENGQLCTLSLSLAQQEALQLTRRSVDDLMQTVFLSTGNPCAAPKNTKLYECHHKACGYGGYDKFFLGVALESEELQNSGLQSLFVAVAADHRPSDGHVPNTATVVELALRTEQKQAKRWAKQFKALVEQRLQYYGDDPVCNRLGQMSIPKLRTLWGESAFSKSIFKVASLSVLWWATNVIGLPILRLTEQLHVI